MTTITNKKQYPSEQYLNELITNIEFAARAPVEVVRAMAAELQKRREADSAEPVAYIFKHPAGKLFWALTDESNKDQSDVIPVYAVAPASVVQDNASEPLAYAYKELTPEIMRNHLAVFERYGIAPNDSSTTIQALRIALDGIERSDAMLHGAEPVSQTYKLPPLSSNEVNDAAWKLHNMLTEHGPLNGRQFNNLKGCFYEALKVAMRNYPVTPDSWISCSERMPVIGELNWRTGFPLLITCEIGVIPAYYGFVSVNGDKHYGFMESFKYGDDRGGHPKTNEYGLISNVTHWMPLPEPPQEVNRG
ncbi:DUF551 domain-containing protein [Salmonella enterica]|uniref:DUF551 domain-containing protein n=2 Tax=Salmonella enterica TaxID=28901 RepID=UPI000778FF25|nr:DUF551 domain-containing protein [Salmonella enterica]EDQ4851283.1 DUF551 domain-containing protein [Salmonella enterica subsp. enterica serovar Saintpaul]HAB2935311.1 DUF551 domain-containing protein [Salmonella enterica subsp. enterica serovar Enteritidis]EAA1104583.1 DUF551 domain-containing protein [Salmonella enterica subsp. enterica]EAB9226898.1 DUF551 domain-containing protein [Salmonella enterica subsp. enterica serovar Minnesota]EAC0137432.1 DUF551 domain-containing protein [Salmon